MEDVTPADQTPNTKEVNAVDAVPNTDVAVGDNSQVDGSLDDNSSGTSLWTWILVIVGLIFFCALVGAGIHFMNQKNNEPPVDEPQATEIDLPTIKPEPQQHKSHGLDLYVEPTVNPITGEMHGGLGHHNTEDDLRNMGYNP